MSEKEAKRWAERWKVQTRIGAYFISTVDLVINHGTSEIPLHYETMVFCDADAVAGRDRYADRYTTRDEAQAGHDATCQRIEEGWKP